MTDCQNQFARRLLNTLQLALQRDGAGFLRFAKACIEKEMRGNSTRSPPVPTWEKSRCSAMFYRARLTCRQLAILGAAWWWMPERQGDP
ncbi:hypothetical protein BGW80DRAFT_1322440 [Lactifluus volemus]|nr:hypothetical protein BGW80DRAFT_1322440 [Lactifluus volemus]